MTSTPKFIAVLVGVFRRLLVLYPRRHREEYGEDMAQLFRDQCREVFGSGHWGRIAGFVGRTAWDLMRTSLMERAASLRTTLTMKPTLIPRMAAVLGGAAAFCVILGTVAVVLSLMPETYMSTARILVRTAVNPAEQRTVDPFHLQTQVERLGSRAVVYPVIEALTLNERWSSRYLAGQGTLQTVETYEILRDKIEVRQIRNSTVLEVRVFDGDKGTAAQIANKLVEVYGDQVNREAMPAGPRVAIIDLAEPGLRAVRPNWPLGLFLGALAAVFVALVTTGFLWWLARRITPVGG